MSFKYKGIAIDGGCEGELFESDLRTCLKALRNPPTQVSLHNVPEYYAQEFHLTEILVDGKPAFFWSVHEAVSFTYVMRRLQEIARIYHDINPNKNG